MEVLHARLYLRCGVEAGVKLSDNGQVFGRFAAFCLCQTSRYPTPTRTRQPLLPSQPLLHYLVGMIARITVLSNNQVRSCFAIPKLPRASHCFHSLTPSSNSGARLGALGCASGQLESRLQHDSQKAPDVVEQAVGSNTFWQGVCKGVPQQLPKALCLAAAAAALSLVVPHVAQAASSAATGEGSSLFNGTQQ